MSKEESNDRNNDMSYIDLIRHYYSEYNSKKELCNIFI